MEDNKNKMWGRTFFPDEHTKRGRTIYEDEHTDLRGDVQVTKTNTHFSVYPHFTTFHKVMYGGRHAA